MYVETEPDEDMSKVLTVNELRILGLVLAEHLNALKAKGLDIERVNEVKVTKEEIVSILREIDRDELADTLSKKRGKPR